jgi:SIR2-like domain
VSSYEDELRGLLDRARVVADAMSAEPQPAERPRYLHDEAMLDALDRLGEHEGDITLIVGAGASMEAGLPSWPELVHRLLVRVAEARFDSAIRERWVEAMSSESLTAAAAVVEALSDDNENFIDRVRAALYGGRPTTTYQPQALAQQVAWLKRRLGANVRLATGNYDGLLEEALEDAGVTVHSYIQRRDEPVGSAAVYHLHGRLIPGYPRTGHIVLSEADYARVQQARSWQDGFMREALDSSLCVIVGASLTDPNLIRWLYRYGPRADGAPRHLALFTRQASAHVAPAVRPSVEEATRARWERVGVDAVFADFFGELAQFLHEVGLRRAAAGVEPFAVRARERFDAGRAVVVPDDPDQFVAAQERASRFLLGLLAGVQRIAAAGGLDLERERLGLGLWGVNHEEGTVGLWATSDRRFTEPAAVIYNPLEYESRWIAVEAATRGVTVERDPNVYASRWRLIRGVPVVVPADGTDGRVTVGVVTLTSMTPQHESQLGRSAAVSAVIDDFLGAAGASVFE